MSPLSSVLQTRGTAAVRPGRTSMAMEIWTSMSRTSVSQTNCFVTTESPSQKLEQSRASTIQATDLALRGQTRIEMVIPICMWPTLDRTSSSRTSATAHSKKPGAFWESRIRAAVSNQSLPTSTTIATPICSSRTAALTDCGGTTETGPSRMPRRHSFRVTPAQAPGRLWAISTTMDSSTSMCPTSGLTGYIRPRAARAGGGWG